MMKLLTIVERWCEMVKFLNILVVASLFAVGCGKKDEVVDIRPEFAPYVQQFEATSAKVGRETHVTNLVMKFGDLTADRERAHCEIVTGETPLIVVDSKVWERLTDSERRALLFHEMGHCVRLRKHLDAKTPDGMPASVMATYPLHEEYYLEHMEQLDTELFTAEGPKIESN